MRRIQAERLLGGYAAGILTEAERAELFAAALANQALFDALADEEALRDLLADPAARQALLHALEPAARSRRWGRPAWFGLAASLLAMVTTGALLWRRDLPLPRTLPAALPPPAPAAVQEAPPSSPAPIPPGKKGVSSRAPEVAPAALDASREAPALDQPAPPPAPAPAAQALRPLERAEALGNAASVALAPGIAGGLTDRARSSKRTQGAATVEVVPSPAEAPTVTQERLASGYLRVAVDWDPSCTLYLLHRAGTGTRLLTPVKTHIGSDGLAHSTYLFPLAGADVVDLYQLAAPVAHPEQLPGEGPVAGHRQRLQPRKP